METTKQALKQTKSTTTNKTNKNRELEFVPPVENGKTHFGNQFEIKLKEESELLNKVNH